MAVDYLSALNVGSGLNVTQIVDALVDAERAPREAQLNEKVEEKTVSVSALGEVKADMKTFDDNLALLSGNTSLTVASTNKAVSVETNGKFAVSQFSHKVEVSQLATSQTLVFDGFSSSSDTVSADQLVFDFGSWGAAPGYGFTARSGNTPTTITLTPPENTIADLANKINNASMGVTANVIRVSDGNYALSVVSETGSDNQMRVLATTGGATVSALNFDPETTAADIGNLVNFGQNAQFTLDGVTITRDSNEVEDLVNGVKITLNETTSSPLTISSSYDRELAKEIVNLLVAELNFMIGKLTELTYRGTAGEDDAGALAGDPLIKSYLSTLKSQTVTPIVGYGADDLYLSNFGVMTERDGTLGLNETKFNEFFDTNPDAFAALTTSRAVTDSNLVHAELSGSLWEAGSYAFNVNSDATATLDGVAKVETYTGIQSSLLSNVSDGKTISVDIDGQTISYTVSGGVSVGTYTVADLVTDLTTANNALATPADVSFSTLNTGSEDVLVVTAGTKNRDISFADLIVDSTATGTHSTTTPHSGNEMSLEAGKYKVTTGGARGLALTLLGNGEDTDVYIGKSLLQSLQEFSRDILAVNNPIDQKITSYNDDIADYNDKLTDLATQMETQRTRYVERFTAMESSVASLKETGDLITNFMDAWRAGLE